MFCQLIFMPALIPRFVSFCRTHHLRASESKGHQQPIDLVWLWFRSPSDWLAASTMRSSEPPYRPGPERCPCAACPARRAPVVSETPGEADYSLAKVPLQRGPVRPPPNIDEQGSLPYKPRQLSAMTRPDPGSFGARGRFGRAGFADISHSSIRQIASLDCQPRALAGKVSAENDP